MYASCNSTLASAVVHLINLIDYDLIIDYY